MQESEVAIFGLCGAADGKIKYVPAIVFPHALVHNAPCGFLNCFCVNLQPAFQRAIKNNNRAESGKKTAGAI
jgi:hypothetical protein